MRTYGLFIALLWLVGCTGEPTCLPLPCPSNAPWDPATCSCHQCELKCAAGAKLNAHMCECEAADAASAADATSDAVANACLPLPCPLGAPWDAASCSCRQKCDLDLLLAQRATGGDGSECGVLKTDASAAALLQAQSCVLDALRARRPFKLIHWLQGTDSAVAEAYAPALGAGPGTQSLISILHFDSDSSGGGGAGASVGEQTCQDLKVKPGCQVSAETLCLSCSGEVESRIACTERRDMWNGECHEAGNYQSGKEGSYRPCCAGLSEVFQQSPGEVNGVPGCVDLPLRVYACVEGRCGDGRCEAAEAVPCGCALDCPSAVRVP